MKKFCVIIGMIVLITSFSACKKDNVNPAAVSSSLPATTGSSYSETTSSTEPKTETVAATTEPAADDTTESSAEKAAQAEENFVDIVDGFKQAQIKDSATKAKAAAEYRVVIFMSWQGDNYYSLQVFPDNTGKFTYIKEDYINKSKLNKTKNLNSAETQTLLGVLKTNDFWNIPTIHPDELIGFDGDTIYIQGYENGKLHLIKMWAPEKTYGIYKIYKAFDNFAQQNF